MTMQIEIKNDNVALSREGVGYLHHTAKGGQVEVTYSAIEPVIESKSWCFALPASVEVWYSNGHHRVWDYAKGEPDSRVVKDLMWDDSSLTSNGCCK